MAGDALAVLDDAGEDHAAVYGISLGGLIGQEVALRQPDRVDALVLGASTAGGFATYLPPPSSLARTFLTRVSFMGPEEAEWAAVAYTYAEKTRRCHPERIVEHITHRLRWPTTAVSYLHHWFASSAHDAYERLNRIAAPTLVVHGEQDVVVPPANALVLAERIPGAQLKLWPDAAHMYTIDEPRADEEVLQFLQRQSDLLQSAKFHGR
jgi:pimeloyl-ACP methyl ester carboxylesterase